MTFAFFEAVDGINLITVDTTIDEFDGDFSLGDTSLREAVAIANGSDSPHLISFSDALNGETLALTLGEIALAGEIFINGDIDGDGQPDITLDADNLSRIFNVTDDNVVIEGLTLVNGSADGDGGALYVNATLDILNSVIRDSFAAGHGGGLAVDSSAQARLVNTTLTSNIASIGGGVHVGLGSELFASGSAFLQNEAFSLGGGLHNIGQLNLTNNLVDSNQSGESGGGLYSLGQLILADSTVSNNRGLTRGGGLSIGNGDTPGSATIRNSTIEKNSADFFGGGINNSDSTLLLIDSSVSANAVDFEGGGIYGSGEIINSSIAQNSAYEYGGGLSGDFVISNSVITQNTAQFGGGFLGGGTLTNSLVAGNTAKLNGGGIRGADLKITNSTISGNKLDSNFFSGAGLESQGVVELENSIISGSVGGDDVFVSDAGELLVNGANIIEDSSFVGVSVLNVDPLLGEIADNGGSLPSQFPLPGSPAIDTGDNSLVIPNVDQRGEGFDRIVDGNGDGASIVDLGAIESSFVQPPMEDVYLTLKKGASLQGLNVESHDILKKSDSITGFSLFFDGSDVGLNDSKLSAFDVIGNNEILMSFAHETTLQGLGLVDDSDIVKFTASSIGENTTGVFELYLDGSDVGLEQPGEDIDALTQLSNGDILVSTKGNISIPNLDGAREDILRFSPTALGEETSGTLSKYLDMSDVGLDYTNVDALHVRNDGEILISTAGQFSLDGGIIANEDVFGFTPTNTGESTAGTFNEVSFDGSNFGLLGNAVRAFDVA